MKSRPIVIDMDDLVDAVMVQEHKGQQVSLVDFLGEWKERVPPLKATLFTIPNRTSDATIKAMKDLGDWVALAPHGHEHCRGECLSWTSEEAIDKITMARDRGIDAPVFRAPAWLLDGEVYEACRQLDYVVASHQLYRIPSTGVREYVYNLHMGVDPPRTKRVHGHLTPVCDNWYLDMHANGHLPKDPKGDYMFPWEVATIIPATVTVPTGVALEPVE